MITAGILSDKQNVRHGFFTRQGGVSEGRYASLNCGLGSGDDPDRVRSNRARAMDRLGLGVDALATAYQVHSAQVAVIDQPFGNQPRPHVDGMVTRTPGVVLGILTADCAPVLFADDEAGVIGAAHAGWRGAKAGIIEATVQAMIALGAAASRIVAAVGPCIRQESYEVGREFHAAFVGDEPESAALFGPSARAGHYQFDLPGYVAGRLAALDLAGMEIIACDTFADPDRFFSYRRMMLNGGGDYGRGLSAIALAP